MIESGSILRDMADVLAIPTMTKRNLRIVERDFLSTMGFPYRRMPTRQATFRQVYKAMWGERIPEDVCTHTHRTAKAARACPDRPK